MMGVPFDILLEMLHPWANLLGHVAHGRGNNSRRWSQELGIDLAYGGTWSTGVRLITPRQCFGRLLGWRSLDFRGEEFD